MNGLKPCPNCEKKILARRREGGFCFVECLSCKMMGPGKSKIADAQYAWNSLPRRHEITPNSVDCQGCPERQYRSHDHD